VTVSKGIYILAAVVAVVIFGGALHWVNEGGSEVGSSQVGCSETRRPRTTKSEIDHGDFQKRFQPQFPRPSNDGASKAQ